MDKISDELGLNWLFSHQEKETKSSKSFKYIHKKDDFTELEINEDDELGLSQLFQCQDEETEASKSFKCIHDRDEFEDLKDTFQAHNKEFHKRFKRKCKICYNVFRDTKQLKTHMKKFHSSVFMMDVVSLKLPAFVCTNPKCSNVFKGERSLQIHLNQQHPKLNSGRKRTSTGQC